MLQDIGNISVSTNFFIPFGLPNLINPSTSAIKAFVFTSDNLPCIYLMRLLLTNRKNILLSGPTGRLAFRLAGVLLQVGQYYGPTGSQS